MNSYRIVGLTHFPEIVSGNHIGNIHEQNFPGFTKVPDTIIEKISDDAWGFEYFSIKHEMVVRDSGIAFGFFQGEPVNVEFSDYLKRFSIPTYVDRQNRFALLVGPSLIVNDLLTVIGENAILQTRIQRYELNLLDLRSRVSDFLGVWFRKVSARVNSSALFGSDLANEPLFEKILEDGAELSSLTLPFRNMTIQLNQFAGISSHQKVETIEEELNIVRAIKEVLVDPIKIEVGANA